MAKRQSRFLCKQVVIGITLVLLVLMFPAAGAVARNLSVIAPDGGEWYEPGETIQIQWSASGTDWQSSDTVKIEYTTNSGSDWNTIQAARRLPYNSGSYSWDTSGITPSSTCYVRITCNNDKNVYDTSNASFTLMADTIVPVITHTPLNEMGGNVGPYHVSATVTDNRGLAYVKLFWSKNGSEFQSLTMVSTGVPNEVSASIPGHGEHCDYYRYYIEACDSSSSGNNSRSPTLGSASPNYFGISSLPSTEIVSGANYSETASAYMCGNCYTSQQTTILTEFQQYLSFPVSTELRFFVYTYQENPQNTWKYVKTFEAIVPASGAGLGWYSSGPVSIRLDRGQKYWIGCAWRDSGTFYYGQLASATVSFGKADCKFELASYPPPTSPANGAGMLGQLSYQKLTTFPASRGLAIDEPYKEKLYEPGDDLVIRWHPTGECWQNGDTVRLQYTSNNGTSWTQIAGAENLSYDSGSFTWNTTEAPWPSSFYRVRAVWNANDAVSDISDDNLYLDTDTWPPSISHTALTDTTNRFGPYKVQANIYETYHDGLADATVYWSRNGSTYSAVPMLPTSYDYQYSANIPGLSSAGDVYNYYIVAHDASQAHNEARSPATGTYQFCILPTPPEYFTEEFNTYDNIFDLQHMSILFTPDGSSDYYSASVQPIAALPTDPEGGRVVQIAHDTCEKIVLEGGAQVSLYDMTRDNVWISTEGYITFDQGMWIWWMDAQEHFDYKQVAAYCRNLDPLPGSVTYKQLSDRIAVTYLNVPCDGRTVPNTFQIEMFFDGRIRLSYLDMDPNYALVGLSKGTGLPADFVASNLSNYQVPRGTALVYPNGGEWIEPGETVSVSWRPTGVYWNPSDTVSLDYSEDGGATWNSIPGASSLPWDQDSFVLDTSSLPPSQQYKFRVTADNDVSITDSSDADVTIAPDTQAPAIIHEPLAYSGDLIGPYRVCAQVTDNRAIASVTLYWNKNGGPFTSVAMYPTDLPGEYSADIPGPSVLGDKYCYYIEACDTAMTANVTRSPSDAQETHSLTLVPGAVDILGNSSMSVSAGSHFIGNIYECTSDSRLTQIEHYLNVSATTDIYYVVYESASLAGTYSKIAQVITKDVSPGIKWCSSGPISVHLSAGHSYLIGEVHTSAGYYVKTNSPSPVSVSFGQFRGDWLDYACYPEPEYTVNNPNSTYACYQRLTSCPGQRDISLTAPNGGQWYEPGETVPIGWQPSHSTWTATDTVRLEYSTDSGSTWQTIPGAASLPYNAGSYRWITGETIASEQCRVRVLMNGYEVCNDSSDADFAVLADTVPPVITHTPLTDTANLNGPYSVTATITDNYGVSGATLYWSKNEGSFTAVPMSLTASAGTYSADIPGPSALEDRYCYYIVATDTSLANNVCVDPASAPEEPHCVSVVSCGNDEIGAAANIRTTKNGLGSVYYCAINSTLTQIEQYLAPASSTEIRFAVYECSSATGTYTKLHETVATTMGHGEDWYSSGPVSVQLRANRYYAICGFASNSSDWLYDYGATTTYTYFGQSIGLAYMSSYPPQQSIAVSTYTGLAKQRLSTCRVPRALEIKKPNGGEWYESGDIVQIEWIASGLYWLSTDTVRLEYSSDGGVTWSLISGAENLAYNAGTFSWDTTECLESAYYKVRVVFNDDEAVDDISNADFTIMADTIPPMITHTPLGNTSPSEYNRYVYATITDNYKVGSATVYWSKNGGNFAAVPMTLSGNSYYCGIPRSGQVGDLYSYYIEAKDASSGANVARLPASGCFEFGLVDWLTEVFGGRSSFSPVVDLAGTSVTFIPDGSRSFYSACTKPILNLPTDPVSGIPLTLTDDSFAQCTLTDGKQVSIFDSQYGSFFVGSNGYITFDAGDTGLTHFGVKRISGILSNLNPAVGGSVSWKQMTDRAAVTYQDVPNVTTGGLNTFQIEMFFDGRIVLSYIRADAYSATCGLSAGPIPVNAEVLSSNLSNYPLCCPATFQITDSVLPADDATVAFGPVPIGSSRTETVTISNTSNCDAILKVVDTGLHEDFSDGIAQGWLECGDANWNVVGAEYQRLGSTYYYPCYSWMPTAWYAAVPFSDFHYQVRVRHGQNSSAPSYIWFRCAGTELASIPQSGYFVSLNTYSGIYQVCKCMNGTTTPLTYATTSSAIVRGIASNVITIDAVGPSLTLYINGTKVCTLTDNTYTTGYVGTAGCTESYISTYTFWFDDIICNPIINGLQADSDSFRILGLPELPCVIESGQMVNLQVVYEPSKSGASHAKLLVSTRGTSTPVNEILLSGAGISIDTASMLKMNTDGSSVGVSGRHVTAVFDDRFYIEDADRSSGICVLWSGTMPAIGNHVTVIGVMTTVDGERAVQASQVFD